MGSRVAVGKNANASLGVHATTALQPSRSHLRLWTSGLDGEAVQVRSATTERPSHAPLLGADWNVAWIPVSIMHGPQGIQPKVEIGSVDDPFEHEADVVADRIMRMPETRDVTLLSNGEKLRRKCKECANEEEEALQKLRKKSGGASNVTVAPEVVNDVLNQPGQPLDSGARAFFETRIGHDFTRVRVHTDKKAAESAKAVHARAYTVGPHIAFGEGQYQATADEGRRLLAHELVHVMQQDGETGTARLANLAINAYAVTPTENIFAPVLARQEDGGDADAGVSATPTDAGADSKREAQDKCVQRLGGCPNSRSGGIPSDEEIKDYNERCRRETGYQSDVQPSCPVAPEPTKPPVCTAMMGGRVVDHWTGSVLRQEHTYVNFEEGTNRWLIEGGPDPASPTVTGAWVKPGNWESRGNRISTPYTSAADCARVKQDLFNATSTYHSLRLPYDPVDGPNSNSFAEQLTYKAGVPAEFNSLWDHQCYYWRKHSRPF